MIWEPCEAIDRKLDIIRLRDWVETHVSGRHAAILDLCYLRVEQMNFTECGNVLGISGERVRQLDKELMACLGAGYASDLGAACSAEMKISRRKRSTSREHCKAASGRSA